ncbi:MAG: ATP-binding protein [Candidatus Bathyarchaeota archaeon]|nr:ATP-binding protein [Candidatus Bathyarchaeota archaeon]
MDQYKWYEHYSYLLERDDIFEIFFPGRHKTNNSDSLQNDCIIISSKKGSGKTELCKMLMYIFSEHERDDKFIVFCGVPDLYSDMEEVIGKKRFLQVDLDEIEMEGDFDVPSVAFFKDIFVVFDDTEKHESKEIEKMLWRLVNTLAQKGRNFRVTLVCILHQLNKGITSTTLLREMDALIIYPKFFDMNTFNTIIHHIGIPKDIVAGLYRLNERFILIRNSVPQYFFLGTSMEKTENYNRILKLAYGNDMGSFSQNEDEEDDLKELIASLKNAGLMNNNAEPTK